MGCGGGGAGRGLLTEALRGASAARRGEFEGWSLTDALGVRRGSKSDARGQQ